MTRAVFLHVLDHSLVELLAVLGLRHVDEIDDDDTAHIAQTELAGEFVGGAEIDVEGIDFLTFGAFAAIAGVDVDDVEGFGVLDDEVGAVLVGHGATERRLNLPGDGEIVENGYVSLVELDDVFRLGRDECNVVAHFFVDLLVVDMNTFKRGVEEVAKQSYRAAGFFVNKRGFVGRIAVLYIRQGRFPTRKEDAQLLIEFCNTTSFGDGANDDTESFGLDAVHELLEARTLGIALDFGRNADLIGEGNEYEVTTGEGNFAGDARSFGRNGFFDDLHQHFLTDVDGVLNMTVFFGIGLARNFVEGKRFAFPVFDQLEIVLELLIAHA